MANHSPHSAPGQAAGYFFQVERAIARLAAADSNAIIAVEKEDDVSVHLPGGQFFLEQDKHTINSRCPFGDTSKSLWNTLDIWTGAAERKDFDPNDGTFCLVTNVELPAGLARQIGDSDSTTIDDCFAEVQRIAAITPPSIRPIADRVVARDPLLVKTVLLHTAYIDKSASSSGAALRQKIASQLHLPDDIDEIDILNALHGWVANELLASWRTRAPGVITRVAFDRQLHRVIATFRTYKKHGLPEHLVNFASTVFDEHRQMRYVRQVAYVISDADEVLDAITDFVRCSTERFRLGKSGDLTADDWTDFDNALTRSWKNIFRREINSTSRTTDVDTGYRVLCGTRETVAFLGGGPAHRYLIVGTLHRLSDALTIGWHPRFKELFR